MSNSLYAISIHALRGEGDFLISTAAIWAIDFYPRPPWGGRPCRKRLNKAQSAISIHALRGEGDQQTKTVTGQQSLFLSTPSVGRATPKLPAPSITTLDFYPRPPWGGRRLESYPIPSFADISIHALRGEGDDKMDSAPLESWYFYPRPPWGGRRTSIVYCRGGVIFLSPPSVGRATRLLIL